jgi:hypothetical protein
MAYAFTTTLARIRAAQPCTEGWEKLLATLGKTKADEEPLPLLAVLDSNGLDDALWVLSYAMPDDRLARHFQAWCAEQVLHIFEAERPRDDRVRNQIAVLKNDDATAEERAAAWNAAWAAAREAARAAARDAAGAAAWNAAWAAARDAAREAAGAAARDAAGAAAWNAAGAAAGAAAWNAAWAAARDAQERQLRAMIAKGE